jgi:hypothetical protein
LITVVWTTWPTQESTSFDFNGLPESFWLATLAFLNGLTSWAKWGWGRAPANPVLQGGNNQGASRHCPEFGASVAAGCFFLAVGITVSNTNAFVANPLHIALVMANLTMLAMAHLMSLARLVRGESFRYRHAITAQWMGAFLKDNLKEYVSLVLLTTIAGCAALAVESRWKLMDSTSRVDDSVVCCECQSGVAPPASGGGP